MEHNFDQLYLDFLSLLPSFYFQGIIVIVVGLHFLIFRPHIFQIDEDLLLLLFILVISITCRLEWILKYLRNIFQILFLFLNAVSFMNILREGYFTSAVISLSNTLANSSRTYKWQSHMTSKLKKMTKTNLVRFLVPVHHPQPALLVQRLGQRQPVLPASSLSASSILHCQSLNQQIEWITSNYLLLRRLDNTL